MKTALKIALTAVLAAAIAGTSAQAARVKDVARVVGVRENQLFGYGLVVGLAGTGDGVRMTRQTVVNMLERLGLNVAIGDINVDNVAAVMVTATLPAFVTPGDKIDVVVSSIGDADSLQGGTLILTPLRAANGDVYAIAQGQVTIGGFAAGGGGGARKTRGHPTVGRITGGATVEREVSVDFMDGGDILYISLNSPDFTTASNMAKGINAAIGPDTAKARDAAIVGVKVPAGRLDDIVSFISQIEAVRVDQDHISKVVINEKTGTIVMGGDVSISPVAIAHGTLTVTVTPEFQINQPDTPFGGGRTVARTTSSVDAEEEKVAFNRVSTSDVVDALNAMGVTPSDIIAILQALKVAGALQAEIVIM
jgi:flagellar P-ring protein precursor FlgI